MDNVNRQSFLELKVIWKDDDVIELSVTASNCDFFGKTEVYDQSEPLSKFALTLIGYPKNSDSLFYETGQQDGYSYFSMSFYPIDNAGHIGVAVTIERNVSRQEAKDKIKLEIIVEPSAIDNFQRELYNLALKESGTAILYGRDNRLDN